MKRLPLAAWGGVALLLVVPLCGLVPASATVVSVASQSAGPGGSVDVCVSMDQSGGKVAGIELLLRWDGGCANLVPSAGSEGQCAANPATRKTLSTAIGTRPCGNDPNCLKAMMVSFSDSRPIPDGELFCCSFLVPDSPTRASCPLTLGNVLGAEPVGKQVTDIQIENGALTITGLGGGAGRQAGSVLGPAVAPAVLAPAVGTSAGAAAPGAASAAPGAAAPAAAAPPASGAGASGTGGPWVSGGPAMPEGSREAVGVPQVPAVVAEPQRGTPGEQPTSPATLTTPTPGLRKTPAATIKPTAARNESPTPGTTPSPGAKAPAPASGTH